MTKSLPDTVAVGNDRVAVAVAPDHGGRIASITVDGVELLVGRGAVPEATGPTAWGSYPMVPWAGRIREGRFSMRGRDHQLPLTLGGHAIHGVGFAMRWTVVEHDATSIALELTLPDDARWPFGGTARQRITVDDDQVRQELATVATDRAFPASIGWHPWFRKPDRLGFAPSAMYLRDRHGITVDELVDVPPGPWDDCFVNDRPVVVDIDGVTVTLTSDCVDWVVYDERSYATCVEPQTAPPDAANMRPHVLEPGDELAAWFTMTMVAAG